MSIGNVPGTGGISELVTVNAETIKLVQNGNAVVMINAAGTALVDDNVIVKPTNKLEVRNKADNDFLLHIDSVTTGEESTSLKGKWITLGRMICI